MSTEGSVSTTSSRIRQFGLYRSIDARTEEFLRLSRKRQIRQGCACAAVSTAITVAVVVAVILIYEYSIISDSRLDTRMRVSPSWLTLMNTTLDTLKFGGQSNQNNKNLDPTTLKLIPLILKSLKKNTYYDKLLEDYSSTSPIYEMKEMTEEAFTKNIFSSNKNLIRMPTSRLYTIEYKTSPIVYYKNPTQSIDYFTKVRKIRDYQRIMNYVDKMISDRVPFGPTLPFFKNTHNINNIGFIPNTTPMGKLKQDESITVNTIRNEKEKMKELKPLCGCPKKISQLLYKLIKSIQKIIPDFTNNKLEYSEPCSTKNTIIITTPKDQLMAGKAFFNTKVFNPRSKSTTENLKKSSVPYTVKPYSIKPDNPLYAITNLLKSSKTYKPRENDKYLHTTATPYTDKKFFNEELSLESTTKSIFHTTKSIKDSIDSTDNNRNFQRLNSIIRKNSSYTTRILNKIDYDDYDITTPDILHNFNILDIHSVELVKNKIISRKSYSNYDQNSRQHSENDFTKDNVDDFSNTTTNILDDDLETTTKSTTSTLLDNNSSLSFNLKLTNGHDLSTQETTTFLDDSINTEEQHLTSTTPEELKILSQESTTSLNVVNYTEEPKFNLTTTEEINTLTPETKASFDLTNNYSTDRITEPYIESTTKIYLTSKRIIKIKPGRKQKPNDITLEEEIEKADELVSEENMKSIENMLKSLNNSETKNDEESELYDWELVKIDDNNNYTSLIPNSRSSYLEIHRTEWKNDNNDNEDYDTNINTDLYE